MRTLIVLILCISSLSANAQKQALSFGKLVNNNEEVIFGFRLVSGKKMAVVCKDKADKYLVYRFGTADNIELSYPGWPDKSSWGFFVYFGYQRPGGKENEGMYQYTLTFTNNAIKYEVYYEWFSEDNSQGIGIRVTAGKKTTNLKGDLKTHVGTPGLLDTKEDLIHNAAFN